MSNSTVGVYRAKPKQLHISPTENGWKFTGFMSTQRPIASTEKYYRVWLGPNGAKFWQHVKFGHELTLVVGRMLRVAQDARAAGKQENSLACIEAFFVKSSHRI